MGLFDKKFCSVCGGKAGTFLTRCDLEGDKEYMCSACQDKCSQDLLREGVTNMNADQIKEHIAYMEMCEKVYEDEFEETSEFTARMNDTQLVSVDDNHNWWVVSNSDDYSIFKTSEIHDFKIGVESSFLDEDDGGGNCPRPGEMREIMERLGDYMPPYGPEPKIEKIYVDVELDNHPWISTARIELISCDWYNRKEICRAFDDAGDLIDFLKEKAYQGVKSDKIEDFA